MLIYTIVTLTALNNDAIVALYFAYYGISKLFSVKFITSPAPTANIILILTQNCRLRFFIQVPCVSLRHQGTTSAFTHISGMPSLPILYCIKTTNCRLRVFIAIAVARNTGESNYYTAKL